MNKQESQNLMIGSWVLADGFLKFKINRIWK